MCTQHGFRVISLSHSPSQGPGTPPESHLWGMVREGALAWMGRSVSRRRGRTEPRPGSAGHRSHVWGQPGTGAASGVSAPRAPAASCTAHLLPLSCSPVFLPHLFPGAIPFSLFPARRREELRQPCARSTEGSPGIVPNCQGRVPHAQNALPARTGGAAPGPDAQRRSASGAGGPRFPAVALGCDVSTGRIWVLVRWTFRDV